jgi:hypothetical protein
MKKNPIKRLILKRETLVQLEHVVGGVTSVDICPGSNLGHCTTQSGVAACTG